jgi:hypothetical protein
MLDEQSHKTLAIIAGTLAMWLKENPDSKVEELTEDGLADADNLGMRTLATSWLRMYYELVRLGEVKLLDVPSTTVAPATKMQ